MNELALAFIQSTEGSYIHHFSFGLHPFHHFLRMFTN
jgi:hypothetical protein